MADDPENMMTTTRQVDDARKGLKPIHIRTSVIRVDEPVLTKAPMVVTKNITGMNLILKSESILISFSAL